MRIEILKQAPAPALAAALAEFEAEFAYPLGSRSSFRISHGSDYPRFFHAMAPLAFASFIARDSSGRVRGTIGVAVRPLRHPRGEARLAAYLGDLKVSQDTASGRTLLHLARAATEWSLAQGAVCAYGVVMDGTARLPPRYTGRFGLHRFEPVGAIAVLRFPVLDAHSGVNVSWHRDEPAQVNLCFQELTNGQFSPVVGEPRLRSATAPIGFLGEHDAACGLLEDARAAKRLWLEDGTEMRAAHLSQFAWRDAAAGAALLRGALAACARLELAPALFTAVPMADLPALISAYGDFGKVVVAPATVFATEIDNRCAKWHLDSSEI